MPSTFLSDYDLQSAGTAEVRDNHGVKATSPAYPDEIKLGNSRGHLLGLLVIPKLVTYRVMVI
jgi:hypothetical protein